jgi:hypothetical protein
MKPDVKEKWLKALREPGRKQTRSVLKSDDGQCCLGVLCEVLNVPSQQAGEIDDSVLEQKNVQVFDFGISGSYIDIPPSEWSSVNADLNYRDMRDLAGMNDEGKSFDEIADYIERNL